MSNIRLFHPENIIENTTSLLSKEHTHYVANVMRMKRGSNINFFNKDGEWLSEIVFLDRDRVEVKFLNKLKEPTKNSNIELAICLVKKSPMDTILQKATELGVTKINLDSSTKLLFADVNSKDNLKKEDLSKAKSLTVLIGPEGDFSPSEIELIHGNPNVVPFTISRNILRSDTAVIGAISLVNFINNFH